MSIELPTSSPEAYEYGRGYILLSDLKVGNIPESIQVEGINLVKKSEYHITLVAANRLASLINPEDSERLEAEITDKFKEFVKENPIEDFELTHEFRLAQRGEKKTVVAMVDIENLAGFYDLLRQDYGGDVPLQPAHITLYSLEPEVGISLSSQKDLDNDTRVIDIPELGNIERL